MAEFPARIKEIFLTDVVNEAGCYGVSLCINGEFKDIYVDDLIPCHLNADGEVVPAFSKSKNNELWVLILEKIWAKINHNYENTVTGFASEAFRCLTGAPVEFYNHDYTEDIWT